MTPHNWIWWVVLLTPWSTIALGVWVIWGWTREDRQAQAMALRLKKRYPDDSHLPPEALRGGGRYDSKRLQ